MRKIHLISLIALAIFFVFSLSFIKKQKIIFQWFPVQFFCLSNNQFSSDVKKSKHSYNSTNQSVYILNSDNTIRYVYENFDMQKDQSRIIEQFESLSNLSIDKNIANISLDKEKMNGKYSLAINIKPETVKDKKLILRSDFNNVTDLKKWNDHGFISGWIKIKDRSSVTGVGIRIGDVSGNYREFTTLSNLQIDVPNFFNEDDIYPNIKYRLQNSVSDEWTDFWLNNGWNYLLYRTDREFYKDTGVVDMTKLKWFEIILTINKDTTEHNTILLDNFRIQDGLQKNDNPIGNFWYPPHGRPQYGVFDVDETIPQDYVLKLINIRQTQYPSNGDHGRMITKGNTPLNFTMRVRYKLIDLANKKERDNTWLRIMYDFDPIWDPGHDWFGIYQSLEWNKFGLITVIPMERFSTQEQEPKKENISLSSKGYSMKENKIYEINLTVEGQKAAATLYDVENDCLKNKKSVVYQFSRKRYDMQKRYPIGIEITGNTKAIIYEVEIFEL